MSFHGPQQPLPQQEHTQPTNRNESFNVAPGGFVESFQPHGFSQIQGIWVDNFSGGWLSIEHRNLWVPPYTRGWKASILPSMSAITIRSYDFANGVVIAGANGTDAIVTLWNEPAGDSEGIDFFDQQHIPIVQAGTLFTPGAFNIIAAPAVGRLRIYEAELWYFDNTSGIGDQVNGFLDTVPSGINIASTSISPASPADRITIVSPGGDAPIGEGIRLSLNSAENPANASGRIGYLIRYAIR